VQIDARVVDLSHLLAVFDWSLGDASGFSDSVMWSIVTKSFENLRPAVCKAGSSRQRAEAVPAEGQYLAGGRELHLSPPLCCPSCCTRSARAAAMAIETSSLLSSQPRFLLVVNSSLSRSSKLNE